MRKSNTTGPSSKRNKGEHPEKKWGEWRPVHSPVSMRKNQYTHEAQAVELIVGRWHGPLMTSFFFFNEKSNLMGGGLSGQVLEI